MGDQLALFNQPKPPRPNHFYFALRPSGETRLQVGRIAGDIRAETGVCGRWLPWPSYHLSLGALEDDPDPFPPHIHRAVQLAGRIRVHAFELPVTHSGTFGSAPGHYYGWLGVDENPEALLELWYQLHESLSPHSVRLPLLSAFTPHITLVREADRPLPSREIRPILWRVDHIVLVRTTYEPEFRQDDLATIPLLH